jgi:hypothetical protein
MQPEEERKVIVRSIYIYFFLLHAAVRRAGAASLAEAKIPRSFFGLGREKPILALLLTAGRGRDHRHHGLNDYIPHHDLAALDVVSGGRSEELLLHVTMFVIS